jgi:hypothetical protein
MSATVRRCTILPASVRVGVGRIISGDVKLRTRLDGQPFLRRCVGHSTFICPIQGMHDGHKGAGGVSRCAAHARMKL